jgi:methylated-DNA-[protein]-cysteine S-methyltransferase
MQRVTFDTPLGRCALAWHAAGLTGFSLPDAPILADDVATPPPDIAAVIVRVRRHLSGEPQDFSDLRYDFTDLADFHRRVLRATLEIKSGHTRSYGEIAEAIAELPVASRAVGAALGANRWPLLIPCHRVVSSEGKMIGFSGPGGVKTKLRLLALEGAQLFGE